MKVVLDTNVFISGIFWDTTESHEILKMIEREDLQLVTSLEILDELLRIMLGFKIVTTYEKMARWRFLIISHAKIVSPSIRVEVVQDDPDDDRIIEAALEGGVDMIITQDKHLLKIGAYKGIRIIDPRTFLNIYI